MPQLVNVSMIFVVTFVVFPGVAASWAPQLEFFTSKGRWEAVGSSENLSGIVFWRKSDSVLLDISGLFRSSIFFYGLLLQYASFTGKWHFKWFSKVKRCAWIKHAHVWLASIPRRMSSVSRCFSISAGFYPICCFGAALWHDNACFWLTTALTSSSRSQGKLGQDWYTTLVVGIFQIFDVVGRSTPQAWEPTVEFRKVWGLSCNLRGRYWTRSLNVYSYVHCVQSIWGVQIEGSTTTFR